MTSGHSHHIDMDSIMLDPTYGSGSAVRAAESLGAKPGPVWVWAIRFAKEQYRGEDTVLWLAKI
jgi:hypothetical protein